MDAKGEKKLPCAEGLYWFWGYRYDTSEKPVLKLMEVRKIRNGFSYVLDGNFFYESETNDNFFVTPALAPELPQLVEQKAPAWAVRRDQQNETKSITLEK